MLKAASRHLTNLTVTINPILTIRNLIVHQTAFTYSSEPKVIMPDYYNVTTNVR